DPRLLIETLEREVPRGCRAPVGHHPALVTPCALEHLVQKMVVPAGILAIDLVVPGHDRTGLRAFDCDLEGEQVGLAVRVRVDDRVEPVTVGLVAVEREVLERRDHLLALDAVDLRGDEDGAQVGIFGEVLEVPPITRVAQQVAPAGELDIEAPYARLTGDRLAAFAHELRIEARPERRSEERRVGKECRGRWEAKAYG